MAPLKPGIFWGVFRRPLKVMGGPLHVRGPWQGQMVLEQNSGAWAPCEDRSGAISDSGLSEALHCLVLCLEGLHPIPVLCSF